LVFDRPAVSPLPGPPDLDAIYAPVVDGLARVESRLTELGEGKFSYLTEPLDHMLESIGKMMRPAVTLLSAGFHPNDGKHAEIMAGAVELLHIATLIHDDTVDDSDLRRGRATVANLWGRDAAVVVGDYIFAASATFVCDTGNVRVIRRFAETIMELSKGQLYEMANAYSPEQDIKAYLDRIYNKTASLFATAAESGAVLSGTDEPTVQALRDYGYNLGMAFQIFDDILDVRGSREKIGKPVGNDLLQGVVTLPVLTYMKRNPGDTSVADFFNNPEDRDPAARVIEAARAPEIIYEACAFAHEMCEKAREALSPLPDVPERQSLLGLVDYVIARDR
jgi:heptaprenyl diphosphate synthase